MKSETNLRHPGVWGIHRRLFLAGAAAGAAAVAALGSVLTQSAPGLPELSAYSAAERERVLSEAAKKEKTLTLYTSIAQKDIGVLTRQCLDRRVTDMQLLAQEVAAWQNYRNLHRQTIEWTFTRQDADRKLKCHYVA